MGTHMRFIFIIIFSLGSLTGAHAMNRYEDGARRMWASYLCAGLARMANLSIRHKQLTYSGTSHGRPLLEAIKNGDFDARKILEIVPPIVITQTNKNVDFQLGALWMAANNAAIDNVNTKIDKNSDDVLPFINVAKQEYNSRNCDLL